MVCLSLGVQAGTVAVQNGDRLSGELISIREDKLVMDMPYTDEQALIPIADIVNIKTAKQTKIHLNNGDILSGVITGMKDGRISLDTAYGGEKLSIPFADIKGFKRADQTDGVENDASAGLEQGAESTGITAAASSASSESKTQTENSEQEAEPAPDLWDGSVSVSGNRQSGNTERTSAGAEVDATRETEYDSISLLLRYNYAAEDGAMTARNVYGEMSYSFNFTERWYWILSSSLLSDDFRGLNLRTTAGIGIGYRWLKSERFSLNTEAGLTYISRNYETSPDETEMAARIAADFEGQLTESLSVFEKLTLYPSLQGGSHIVHNEIGLRSRITDAWHLKIAHVTDYNSDPPAGLEDTDTTLTLGLGYNF